MKGDGIPPTPASIHSYQCVKTCLVDYWVFRLHQRRQQHVRNRDSRLAGMNVHEYQGKEILRKYGVATPQGVPCFSVAEADAAARRLGGKVWVVKAQIHAGGRG